MKYETKHPMILASGFAATLAVVGVLVAPMADKAYAKEKTPSGKLVQHGSMHDTIGKQNHEPRVTLRKILKNPHFYGVGAVAGLDGEVTILDSKAIVTSVDDDRKPRAKSDAKTVKATMLIGQSVADWTELIFEEDVAHNDVDSAIGNLAAAYGIDIARPFMFVIEGECTDVRLHVINGSCPIRARMKKEAIADERMPFEFEARQLEGTVVGVYASDSVGDLTHPATKQHAHLIYLDPSSGKQLTGHLEQYGIKKGMKLKLPKISK